MSPDGKEWKWISAENILSVLCSIGIPRIKTMLIHMITRQRVKMWLDGSFFNSHSPFFSMRIHIMNPHGKLIQKIIVCMYIICNPLCLFILVCVFVVRPPLVKFSLQQLRGNLVAWLLLYVSSVYVLSSLYLGFSIFHPPIVLLLRQ